MLNNEIWVNKGYLKSDKWTVQLSYTYNDDIFQVVHVNMLTRFVNATHILLVEVVVSGRYKKKMYWFFKSKLT